MFPEIDYDFEFEEEQDAELLPTKLGRAPLFDFKKRQYVLKDGKVVECTQEQAVRQWVSGKDSGRKICRLRKYGFWHVHRELYWI